MGISKYVTLARLMRNERASREALMELQSRKLRQLVRHAYEYVPFYRRVFQSAGVRPIDIRTAADLRRLPVIDKNVLRRQPLEDVIDCRRRLGELIEKHTSGSSGSPFRFFVDPAFDAHCKAQYLRPYLSNGRTLFDRVLHFTAFPDSRPRWFHRVGLMRETQMDCSAPAAIQLDALRDLQPTIVQGYPSVLEALAARIDPEAPGFAWPRMVFTDSELLLPAARRRIDEAFGAPVFDVFGAFETDNIGYECHEHAGYHLAIDCVVAEFVRDGEPVPPGQVGDLVCTVLDNYAMPLIRYNLDDTAAASPDPCRCGRGLPLMSVIEGRRVDSVLLPDGSTRSPMRFLGSLDSISEIAFEYQVVQTARNSFRVNLVPRRGLGTADRERITEILRSQLPEAEITVHEQDEIAREPSGKRRTFIRQA